MTGLLAALKSLENLLMRAELKLRREGLQLRLESDGSGWIEDINADVVLQFARHEELVEWLRVPVAGGKEVPNGKARAAGSGQIDVG